MAIEIEKVTGGWVLRIDRAAFAIGTGSRSSEIYTKKKKLIERLEELL